MKPCKLVLRNARVSRILALSIVLACASILPACAPADPPASALPGFYDVTQQVPGGKAIDAQASINLFDVDVFPSGDATVVQLAFANGSRHDSALDPAGPPAYTVSMWEHPARLVVTMQDVRYWEYADDWAFQTDDVVQGVLRRTTGDGATQLIVPLSEACGFQIEEHRGSLRVLLRALPDAAPESGYAVVADAYELTNEGFSLEGYTPTLANDGASVRMISQRFETPEEAESERARVADVLREALPDGVPCVVALADGPPDAMSGAMHAMLAEAPYRSASGITVPGDVLVVGGRFLCWMPGERAAMAFPMQGTRRLPAAERVYLVAHDGRRVRLLDAEFVTIAQAMPSPDGSLLGLIEQDGENRYLALYDIRMRVLNMLSEEGFGRQTASFAYLSEGLIAGITGDGSMQLGTYDLMMGADEGTSRVTALEERPAGYGPIAAFDGSIYYLDGERFVLRYDMARGAREPLATGRGFALSPDGSMMAITDYEADQEDVQTELRVRDMRNNNEVRVSSQALLMGYFWAADSSRLYYVLADGASEAYPYSLHAYEPARGSWRLGELASAEVYAGREREEIVVVRNAATYGYDPVSVLVSVE